jgi:adenine-specific DNA-methyltransferase
VTRQVHTNLETASADQTCGVGAKSASFTTRIVVGDPDQASSNLVMLGDNVSAMHHLLADEHLASTVDLIYIDPPFCTGRVFEGQKGRTGYSDVFSSDAEYLRFLRDRLRLLRQLMSDRGSLYLQLDRKYGYLARRVIDRTIGRSHFRNEITRIKCNPKNSKRKVYGNQTDVIYFFSFPDAIWNGCREPVTKKQLSQYSKVDADERRYTTSPVHASGTVSNGATGDAWRDMLPPPGKHWATTPEKLDQLDAAGLIEWSSNGNPRRKLYLDDVQGRWIQDVWEFKDKGGSRDDYPTEKNLAMLERIILQSSAPGSTVLDCFMGSGTTLVAAAKHGRRFIGIDESHGSLASTVGRLSRETTGAFTITAQRPIVVNQPYDQAIVDAHGLVRLANDLGRPQPDAMLAGVSAPDGTWRVRPLQACSGAWSGVRQNDTHVIVVDGQGGFTALTLTSDALTTVTALKHAA